MLNESVAPHGFTITQSAADKIGKQVEAYGKAGWFKSRNEKLTMARLMGLKSAYVGNEKGAKVIDADHVQKMIRRLACPFPLCAPTTLLRNKSVTSVVLMPSPRVDYEKFRINTPKKFLGYKIRDVDDIAGQNPKKLATTLKVDDKSAKLMISQARIISGLSNKKTGRTAKS